MWMNPKSVRKVKKKTIILFIFSSLAAIFYNFSDTVDFPASINANKSMKPINHSRSFQSKPF